ncbi:hypothetical protein J2128_000071 [Methanomicrobium sp. W14]|nr:hypothetical protein [Methanomicrobium sp. W14]
MGLNQVFKRTEAAASVRIELFSQKTENILA